MSRVDQHEYTHGGSPEEVEMELCSQCGHMIPVINMPLHMATCRRHSHMAHSADGAEMQGQGRVQHHHQGQVHRRQFSSTSSSFRRQLSHHSNIGSDGDDDNDDNGNDDDDSVTRSPPRSRARTNFDGEIANNVIDQNHRQVRFDAIHHLDINNYDPEADHEIDHDSDEDFEMDDSHDLSLSEGEVDNDDDDDTNELYDHDHASASTVEVTNSAGTSNVSSENIARSHNSRSDGNGVARIAPRSQREEEVIDLAGDDDDDDVIEIQWPCPVCTLLNDGDSHQCEACGFNNHNNIRRMFDARSARSRYRASRPPNLIRRDRLGEFGEELGRTEIRRRRFDHNALHQEENNSVRNTRNMTRTTTTTTTATMRPPDPVIRDRLVGLDEDLDGTGLRGRLGHINALHDQLAASVLRNQELARAINASSTTTNGSRNCDNGGSDPNPNQSSVMRTVGNSALLGSAIGAISGIGSNQSFFRSAFGGAVAGAVGGALSASLSPTATPSSSSSSNINRPQPTSHADFTRPIRGYRVYRVGGPNVPYRFQFLSMGGANGIAPGGFDAIDNMSYERLLEVFGDGTENRGTDAAILHSFPTTTIKDVEKELPVDHRNCAICLDDFENGQERKTLPCLHGFHAECIDRWLQSNSTCPVCKYNVQSSSS